MKKPDIFSIPNYFSFYRLLAAPVIFFFILSGQESLFAIFLILNLISDVIDGIIARKLNMETEFGARLDSIADNTTYLLAFTGIYFFKLEEIMPHIFSFLIFIGMIMSTVIVSFIRFGKVSGFHLYSFKIGGYIHGLFFILLFTTGFIAPVYYLMVIWGILAAAEHITIQLILPELRTNVKGVYWVLREMKN
jgi:cardiolipin synthase (CMP-forming)